VDEFYDLRADPAEMNNLATIPGPSPAMRTLQQRLLSHLAETKDAMLYAKFKEYLSVSAAGSQATDGKR
jgi:hypothetical protein